MPFCMRCSMNFSPLIISHLRSQRMSITRRLLCTAMESHRKEYRRGDYATLTDSDLAQFERMIGKENVKTTNLDSYNCDWMKHYKGSSKCVLLPQGSEEISSIVKYCYHRKIAMVPQSGNTGVVGGSTPVFDEVILSLRRHNVFYSLDTHMGIMECDSGFILQNLNSRLATKGFMMPFDLAAKGQCLIGGNISTAAGGIHFVRYGSLHSHVLGLQVVLPNENATIVDFGSPLRKDNTGLHTHHLFIGAEGQLGIITRVTMGVVPKPKNVQVAMLGVQSFENCHKALRLAHEYLGETLSAFELIDSQSMDCLLENEKLSNVLQTKTSFNVLVESSGSNEDHNREKMTKYLTEASSQGIAVDGVQATNVQQATYMWTLRESLPVSLKRDGYIFKFDISLPLEHFYALAVTVRERVGRLAKRVLLYGHMGDGNAHLNITAEKCTKELSDKLYPFIYDWVTEHGGSISAEHGIGLLKKPYMKKDADYEVMKLLKNTFDPRHILSPYKMLE
ncbi:hypothetical protein AB6A40_005673 [Gnathostoma spinigerum]|uniref:D-2-hydroxyglutarate dehydrogenase, mitochondrial n=1 Tax=Gnathostoma spinigerum TaxID=75299 RepID=A0ABD6ENS7_9BILA